MLTISRPNEQKDVLLETIKVMLSHSSNEKKLHLATGLATIHDELSKIWIYLSFLFFGLRDTFL